MCVRVLVCVCVYTHPGLVHHVLVDVDQPVDGALPEDIHTCGDVVAASDRSTTEGGGVSPDLQRRQVRQEVVPHKEAHEDPVVHAALKVKLEGQTGHGQLPGQVLEQQHQ